MTWTRDYAEGIFCKADLIRSAVHRFVRFSLIAFVPILQLFGSGASLASTQTPKAFTLEQRIVCQTTIEDIRWSHRIWPADNPGPKPSLSAVLSDVQIRGKVQNSLQMEEALAGIYGMKIDATMLQAELNRMALNTRAPDRLRELFAALGNDPVVIAECLVRPTLVEHNLYNSYVWDNNHHGLLRKRAEAAMADLDDPGILEASGGREQLLALVRKEDGVKRDLPAAKSEKGFMRIELDPEEFAREVARKSPVGTGPDDLATRTTGLRETENAFVYETVLDQARDRLEVRSLVWQKQGFHSWWMEQSTKFRSQKQRVLTSKLTLPVISGVADNLLTTGEADSWVIHGLSTGRSNHTAVWTGSEMIIWGGKDATNPLNTGGRYDPVTFSWTATSKDDVDTPSGRFNHTAVWTGSEMIIWGGNSGTEVLRSGGRYDSVTNNWVPTKSYVLDARQNHTAVWTGEKMIIWGGEDGGYLDTGGVYDPLGNYWVPTNEAGAPSPRSLHTAVWTGNNRMMIWGGYNKPDALSTGGLYDLANNSWMATATDGAPKARFSHTAISTGKEMIIWGGYGGGYLNTGGLYDPRENQWVRDTLTNGTPHARTGHTAVWTDSEMIIWGGLGSGGSENTGGRYDPDANGWIETSIDIGGRYDHTAIWTGNRMIVWGGYDGTNRLDTGGLYDPGNNLWFNGGKAPGARAVHTTVWTGSEMIIWGGYDGANILNTGGRYDPVIHSWELTDTSGAPTSRSRHTAVWTGTEMIVWGGSGYDVSSAFDYLDTGGHYDPNTLGWAPTDTIDVPTGRSSHTAVWTGREMIIWGGFGYEVDATLGNLDTGGRYDPFDSQVGKWTATNTFGPSGRRDHTAVWAESEMIIWGGFDGSDHLDNGGLYDPVTNQWRASSVNDAPAGRSLHTSVWTGSEMIIWGGANALDRLDTGGHYDPFDGQDGKWLATGSIDAPTRRSEHTSVWSGSEMIIWGGYGYDGGIYNHLDTGARYDPATLNWVPTSTVDAPTGRSHHTAVWTGSEMIIWGGAPYDKPTTAIYFPYDPGTRCASGDLTLFGPIRYLCGETRIEQTEGKLITFGEVVLEPSATVTYEAAFSIELNPGFRVEGNSIFSAVIKPVSCTTP